MIFPVKPKYVIGPDIVKYEGPAYNESPDPAYLMEKVQEIRKWNKDLIGVTDNERHHHLALRNYCGFSDGDLLAMALNLEEDVAIMHKGKLSSICFCFPSGFVPSEKVGKYLAEIHAPVPESERLIKASENMTAAMSRPGVLYRRYVWTLTSLKSLSQHPKYERPEPKGIQDIWFRTETQTTVGMGNETSLFFVKVEMTHLPKVWADTEKRELIKSAVKSMSDDVIAYKGLKKIKSIIER